MNGNAEEGCTFDGMSDLLADGDITLKFDDGSSLVAHSFILERTSPIFKNLLKDSEDGVIQMSGVSKDVWIEILRELYPGTHTFFLKQTRTTYSELLVSVVFLNKPLVLRYSNHRLLLCRMPLLRKRASTLCKLCCTLSTCLLHGGSKTLCRHVAPTMTIY